MMICVDMNTPGYEKGKDVRKKHSISKLNYNMKIILISYPISTNEGKPLDHNFVSPLFCVKRPKNNRTILTFIRCRNVQRAERTHKHNGSGGWISIYFLHIWWSNWLNLDGRTQGPQIIHWTETEDILQFLHSRCRHRVEQIIQLDVRQPVFSFNHIVKREIW